jgi:hypothetical protein
VTKEGVQQVLMAVQNSLNDLAKPYPLPDEQLVTQVVASSLLWAATNVPLLEKAVERLRVENAPRSDES